MRLGGARAWADAGRTVVMVRPGALMGSSDIGLFAAIEPALFLVDGSNLLWRAAHGGPAPFTAADGRDLTTVFRFFSMLRRALGTYGLFAECIVCFDGEAAWAPRLEIDASYKGNRRYEDADLSFMHWLPEIRAALASAGVVSVEHERQEADDVIATLAMGAGGRPVRILSTDRDYYQLVGANVTVLNQRARPAVVGPREVFERYGVEPRQWCDFRALMGDPSDGIPGVPGVGPLMAAKLLHGGRTLEDLAGGARLRDRWEDVLRWRDLIRFRRVGSPGAEPTGMPTPKLPSPTAVCRELGLI